MLAVTKVMYALLTLLASSASAIPHRALFGAQYGPKVVYHHINTTITPPRCGETTVKGNTKFQSFTVNYMKSTFPLAKGNCTSVGFDMPLGPQDMSSKQTWKASYPNAYQAAAYGKANYRYTIKFFGRRGSVSGTGKGAQTSSVLGLAVGTPALSTLVAAIKAAGLVGALSGTGPFTIFAPSNAAFTALGSAVPTLLLPQNKALLAKVLEYHVITGRYIQASQITDGLQEAKTLEGQTLAFGVSGGKVFVNTDAEVTKADIVGSNGIVHVIDKVLLYPGFKLPTAGGGKGKGAACISDATYSDSYGTCASYSDNKWCANGGTGPAWQSGWGGLTAAVQKACCACRSRGGTPPSAPAAKVGPTIVDLAVATPTLSTLVAALQAAGLVATLSSPGPFTVFAPTNAAFATLGSTVTQLLLPKNKAKLVQVLTYHVLAGKILSGAITNGQSAATVEGQKMCFDVNARMSPHRVGIYECGTTAAATDVIKANIIASNGVVHVIDTVLIPPGFSLKQ